MKLITAIAALDVDASILENNAQVAGHEGRQDDALEMMSDAVDLRKAIVLLKNGMNE